MLAIGLMSGTSRDGIDAALIETDGESIVRPLAFHEMAYTPATRALLADACAVALGMDGPDSRPVIDEAAHIVTMLHVEAVAQILRKLGIGRDEVEVIGFHGHTVAHKPNKGWTWQIGNARLLAETTNIQVVSDFRSADVAAGGQGAPLIPVYHRALAENLTKPVAILNLGGVANITSIDEVGGLSAFDCGMANALIDDWMLQETGQAFDRNGELAAAGTVNEAILTAMLDQPFFDTAFPKSLDRDDFTIQPLRGLSAADGAATATAFSAEGVAIGLRLLARAPKQLFVAGGGRHNATLMRMIAERSGIDVRSVDTLGWNGDAVEAEGFAYMAVCSLKHLPISFPGTTGAPRPMTGGVLHKVPMRF
jgi:anhydro-N-acetylmuramic acid kinase